MWTGLHNPVHTFYELKFPKLLQYSVIHCYPDYSPEYECKPEKKMFTTVKLKIMHA